MMAWTWWKLLLLMMMMIQWGERIEWGEMIHIVRITFVPEWYIRYIL